MIHRLIKPFLALALVAAMIAGTSIPSSACLDKYNNDFRWKTNITTVDVTNDDGKVYTIRGFHNFFPNTQVVQYNIKDKKDFVEMELYSDKVVVRSYAWKSFLFFGWHTKTLDQTFDNAPAPESDPFEEIQSQKINYGTYIKTEIYDWGVYFYRSGSEDSGANKGKEYMNFGIEDKTNKTYCLSDFFNDGTVKYSNCKEYMKLIGEQKEFSTIAIAGGISAGAFFLISSICAALASTGIGAPVAIAVLATVFALSTPAAIGAWNAFKKYRQVESMYAVIKNY